MQIRQSSARLHRTGLHADRLYRNDPEDGSAIRGTILRTKRSYVRPNISRPDKDYTTKNVNLFWRWGNDEYRDRLFHIGANCRVVILGYKTEGGGIGFNIAGGSEVEILGGVHTNHGRPLWYTKPYPYMQIDGAEVSVITRFMQGNTTYETYIQDDRENSSKTFPATDFPELTTGDAVERLIPLYIGYGSQRE